MIIRIPNFMMKNNRSSLIWKLNHRRFTILNGGMIYPDTSEYGMYTWEWFTDVNEIHVHMHKMRDTIHTPVKIDTGKFRF